jgi:hypothetical protein
MAIRKLAVVISLIAMIVILSPQARATTTTLQATEDAYVSEGETAVTYDDMNLSIGWSDGYKFETYIKYSLASTSGKTITNAILNVYIFENAYDAGETPAIIVHKVANQTWSEATLSWDNKPVIGVEINRSNTTALMTGWFAFNVTSWVNESNGGNVSFHLNTTYYGSGDYLIVQDRESTDATLRPNLTVTYEGAATSTTWISFNFTSLPQTGCQPYEAGSSSNNQADAAKPIYYIDNTGNVPIDLDFRFSSSLPSGITVKGNATCQGTYTSCQSAAQTLGTSYTQLVVDLAIASSYANITLYADVSAGATAGTSSGTLYIKSSG